MLASEILKKKILFDEEKIYLKLWIEKTCQQQHHQYYDSNVGFFVVLNEFKQIGFDNSNVKFYTFFYLELLKEYVKVYDFSDDIIQLLKNSNNFVEQILFSTKDENEKKILTEYINFFENIINI